MEGKQRLYYALGQLIYCVALADKVIQEEEIFRVHQIVSDLREEVDSNFDIAEIVLLLQTKQHINSNTAYQWALEEIRLCKHCFNSRLKYDYFFIITEVAQAFNGIEEDEESLINRIKDDINRILIKTPTL